MHSNSSGSSRLMISGSIDSDSMISKSADASVSVDLDDVCNGEALRLRNGLSINFRFPGSFCAANTGAGFVAFRTVGSFGSG